MARESRVYVGGLKPDATEREIEDEFKSFGRIRTIWVARKPPGFAFVEFEDIRDAEDAVRKLDGVNGWKVEFSRKPGGGRGGGGGFGGGGGGGGYGGGGGGRGELRCYECNEIGHIARDCRLRGGGAGGGGRGRSPPRRRDYSPPRRRDYSPRDRDNGRDYSPRRERERDYSPRRSPPRARDSPPPRKRSVSPYADRARD